MFVCDKNYTRCDADKCKHQIEVAEVKHGHWVRKKNIVEQEIAVCSVCGEMKRQAIGNYCSVCGAKMDEVSEDGDEITE